MLRVEIPIQSPPWRLQTACSRLPPSSSGWPAEDRKQQFTSHCFQRLPLTVYHSLSFLSLGCVRCLYPCRLCICIPADCVKRLYSCSLCVRYLYSCSCVRCLIMPSSTCKYSCRLCKVTWQSLPPFFSSMAVPGRTKKRSKSSILTPSSVRLSRANWRLSSVCDHSGRLVS